MSQKKLIQVFPVESDSLAQDTQICHSHEISHENAARTATTLMSYHIISWVLSILEATRFQKFMKCKLPWNTLPCTNILSGSWWLLGRTLFQTSKLQCWERKQKISPPHISPSLASTLRLYPICPLCDHESALVLPARICCIKPPLSDLHACLSNFWVLRKWSSV